MSRFTFIRHAQSHANAGGVVMPNADIPLSPLGAGQAERLASLLPAPESAVFVSSFLRTRQTAAPWCARHAFAPATHPLIHEFSTIDHRRIEGLDLAARRPLTEAYWQAADPDFRYGDGAETFREFDARVRAFIAQLDALPAGSLLFGHGMWIALLIWRLRGELGCDSADMRAFHTFLRDLAMPNCAVWRFERDPAQGWQGRSDDALQAKLA